MTESKFKVGDRIAFYHCHPALNNPFRGVGIIHDFNKERIIIKSDLEGKGFTWTLHPKQCRRLVKKKGKLRAALERIAAMYDIAPCAWCGMVKHFNTCPIGIAKEALEGK